jgi:hypothetical protein
LAAEVEIEGVVSSSGPFWNLLFSQNEREELVIRGVKTP